MTLPAILLSLLFLLPSKADVLIVQFPVKGKVSLSLGEKAKAEVERTGTVTKVAIQVEDLKAPASVLAGMNTYVAWAVSPEGNFDNLGELELSGTKGSLEATTRFDRFSIMITAEPHYMVDRPGAPFLYKNQAVRSVTSFPLIIEVGTYEYSSLPKGAPDVPALVMEARAAIAIAASAQAESRAESEFRQAQVAIETMEELFRRASPVDVVTPAAHAAIRRAQRAVFAARQSVR